MDWSRRRESNPQAKEDARPTISGPGHQAPGQPGARDHTTDLRSGGDSGHGGTSRAIEWPDLARPAGLVKMTSGGLEPPQRAAGGDSAFLHRRGEARKAPPGGDGSGNSLWTSVGRSGPTGTQYSWGRTRKGPMRRLGHPPSRTLLLSDCGVLTVWVFERARECPRLPRCHAPGGSGRVRTGQPRCCPGSWELRSHTANSFIQPFSTWESSSVFMRLSREGSGCVEPRRVLGSRLSR